MYNVVYKSKRREEEEATKAQTPTAPTSAAIIDAPLQLTWEALNLTSRAAQQARNAGSAAPNGNAVSTAPPAGVALRPSSSQQQLLLSAATNMDQLQEAKQRGQRIKRRERAQRLLAQKEAKQQMQQQQQQNNTNANSVLQQHQQLNDRAEDSHSGDDDDVNGNSRDGSRNRLQGTGQRPPRPPRPPRPRKKAAAAAAAAVSKEPKEPIFEEDIIDGFAILAFRSYEDLEVSATPFVDRCFPSGFLCHARARSFIARMLIREVLREESRKMEPFFMDVARLLPFYHPSYGCFSLV